MLFIFSFFIESLKKQVLNWFKGFGFELFMSPQDLKTNRKECKTISLKIDSQKLPNNI